MYEELRVKYKSLKGFKTGTSLRLLVEVDKVLGETQLLELKDYGISTLEEFCEEYSKKDLNNTFITLGPERLERIMTAVEKYLNEEEKTSLKK